MSSWLRFVLRALKRWRLWLPAVGLALLAVIVIHELDTWLLRSLPRPLAAAVSAGLEAFVVLVPVLLYVMWRRNAELARAAYRRLERIEALREDLANMLVHDLRNPVVTAGLSVSLLTPDEGGNELTPEARAELAHAASRSLLRAEHMIDDILEVARAEDGHLPLHLALVDIREVVRQAVVASDLLMHRGQIGLRQSLPAEPVTTLADAEKIQRVVENLLANAAKFTPSGGQVEVAVRAGADSVAVTVSDTGLGVPEDLRERIFDRFEQAAAQQRQARHGVGLGLTFARLAVEAHGGTIRVDGTPGEGASFTFTLPLGQELPDPPPEAEPLTASTTQTPYPPPTAAGCSPDDPPAVT